MAPRDIIIKFFNNLENLFNSRSYSEILEEALDILNGYSQALISSVPFNSPSSLTIFRGITFSPKNISHLKNPPVGINLKQGRCNPEGESVFYGAFNKFSIINELNIKPDQVFWISRWHSNPKILFTLNQIGFTLDALKNKNFESANDIWNSPDMISSLNDENLFIGDLLSNFFINDSSYYNTTNILFDIFTRDNAYKDINGKRTQNRIKGLIYPSVANKGRFENIAFGAEAIENGILNFIRVDKVKFKIVDYKVILETLDYSTSTDSKGNLVWNGFGDQIGFDQQPTQFSMIINTNQWHITKD